MNKWHIAAIRSTSDIDRHQIRIIRTSLDKVTHSPFWISTPFCGRKFWFSALARPFLARLLKFKRHKIGNVPLHRSFYWRFMFGVLLINYRILIIFGLKIGLKTWFSENSLKPHGRFWVLRYQKLHLINLHSSLHKRFKFEARFIKNLIKIRSLIKIRQKSGF